MNRQDLYGILFAFQSNPALGELTRHRCTASVPYGGRYRLVDFMLSNLVQAGVGDVGLVVESGYESLLDHVGSGKDWDLSRKHGGLRILPPSSPADRRRPGGYLGRMDALAGVLPHLRQLRQEYVVLANGDLAASLPLDQVLEEHIKSGADITAVCTRQPQAVPRTGTYFTLSAEGYVADAWVGESVRGCLSLEVYVLSARLLLSLIEHCASHGIWSFSGGVLGAMTTSLKIAPWFFSGYAARFQAVEDYYARSMDLLDPAVRQDLFAPGREVRTKDRSDPSTYYGPESACANSLVADGCVIEGQVRDSILFRGVRVEAGAQVSGCILMQGVTVSREACLNFAVADKNALIHPGRMLMGHQSYPLVIAKNAVI